MIDRHPASLRDPAGYLVQCGNRLLRVIRPDYKKEYYEILTSSWLNNKCKDHTVASFRILDTTEASGLIGHVANNCLCLEHDIIGFPSYPSEWPLEMLCAAAELTLSLCHDILPLGIGLKDATPYNVLFNGPRPVFIDILSFEKRIIADPTWLAQGQFIRSFLLPAAIEAHYATPSYTLFLSNREGIEPEEVYRQLSLFARFKAPFFSNVTMPVLLASQAEKHANKVYAASALSNPDKASFIIGLLFNRLANSMRTVSTRKHSRSIWRSYNKTCSYTSNDFSHKTVFIEEFMKLSQPSKVLDVGCNTGHFSFLAARYASEVVATDLDVEVVGELWQRAYKENVNILPLVINLARPTPAQGWRNRETKSFLDRAEGYFDVVLMLAVIHHILVTDQIPFDEIIFQAYKLTKQWLVIEYVGPNDPQFKRLLRGREALYGWFTIEAFEKLLSKHFEIVRKEEIASTGRWLYIFGKKYAN